MRIFSINHDEMAENIPFFADFGEFSAENHIDSVMQRPLSNLAVAIEDFADIQRFSAQMAVKEALFGLPDGSVGLWAVIGATPQSIRSLTMPWPKINRLKALVFSPLQLQSRFAPFDSARLDDWPEPLRFGRNMTSLRAMELILPAYEWIDKSRDRISAIDTAKRDGFSGVVTA